MGNVAIGINLEFVRHADKPFEWAVETAARLGFDYVEPMVHWGRELLSEAGYFHSVSMLDDPYRLRRACEKYGVQLSGLSAHTPLCKPEISTEYLKQAVRFAAEAGAPVVNTDEGPKPTWTTAEEDHVLMRYVLAEAAAVAEPRGVLIGLEPPSAVQQDTRRTGADCSARRFARDRCELRYGQQLPGGRGPDNVAAKRQRSTRTFARKGHFLRTVCGRAGKSHRYTCWLRLWRRGRRLVGGDCHLSSVPARHRAQRRVWHHRSSGT